MTGYVADLSWKSGAGAIEKLDRLRSTMAVNVLKTLKIKKTIENGVYMWHKFWNFWRFSFNTWVLQLVLLAVPRVFKTL